MKDLFNLTFSVEVITPEMAAEYLKKNSMNRPIHKHNLSYLECLMKKGKFTFDPSAAIVFAADGTLLQGQHRLQAAVNTDTTFTSVVIRGADKNSFAAMDTGAKRTGGDILALKGYPNHTRAAAIINTYLSMCRGYSFQKDDGTPISKLDTSITNADILNEYESAPEFYQSVCNLANKYYKSYRLYSAAQYGGICAYLVRRKLHDISRVDEFYRELNSGSTYSYLEALRRKIINANTAKSNKLKLTARAKLTMLSKAWNYFVAGEDRKTIDFRLTDKMVFD